MPYKVKALGYTARQTVVEADHYLASADRALEPQSRGEKVAYELVAYKSRHGISEARRLLETVMGLGIAPEPQEEKP